MRQQLVWVVEGGARCLDYLDKDPGGGVNGPPADDATLEQLADFCDGMSREAPEGSDLRLMAGVHRLLAVILHRRCGRVTATDVMHEVAEFGGLDGMGISFHEIATEFSVAGTVWGLK